MQRVRGASNWQAQGSSVQGCSTETMPDLPDLYARQDLLTELPAALS